MKFREGTDVEKDRKKQKWCRKRLKNPFRGLMRGCFALDFSLSDQTLFSLFLYLFPYHFSFFLTLSFRPIFPYYFSVRFSGLQVEIRRARTALMPWSSVFLCFLLIYSTLSLFSLFLSLPPIFVLSMYA